MKIIVYSAHKFEIPYLKEACSQEHELTFISEKLNETTVKHSKTCDIACLFSSDDCSASIIEDLHSNGIKFITTRSAGFNHIDMEATQKHNIPVAHVPEYSPNAIAEHCVTLMLALLRKLIPSHEQIRNYDFSLHNLVGSELNSKTVGVLGAGNIGCQLIKILSGFGCNVLAYDINENPEVLKLNNTTYTDLEDLYSNSDIISLNLPLNDNTKNIIHDDAIAQMKDGVILINAGRGGLVDTTAIIDNLKAKKLVALEWMFTSMKTNFFMRIIPIRFLQMMYLQDC